MSEAGSNLSGRIAGVIGRIRATLAPAGVGARHLHRNADSSAARGSDVAPSESTLCEAKWPEPGAAELLYKRLDSLGIAQAEVAADPDLVRELQVRCACCDSKEQCAQELAQGVKAADWEQYCLNEATLSALAVTRCY